MDDMTKEYCVSCGDETPYDFFTDVTERMWYVEGSGQLCSKCWNGVYNGSKKIKISTYN